MVASQPDKFLWKGQSKTGCKSYAPATMLKIMLYGYFNKLTGSRTLEKETYRNIELIWLIGDLHPDHWTICAYRRENKEQIRFMTISFREFLKSEGYIDGKTVATDGSKFKAYASRDMLSMQAIQKRLKGIDKKLEEYLEEFQQVDTIEDLKSEFESLGNGEGINGALIDKIANLQEQITKLELQKEQLEKSGKNYLASNDPDANLMRSRDGKVPAYNVQTVVDKKHRMIATAEATTKANDIGELKKNLDDLKEQLDIVPQTLEADTGYSNTKEIKEIEESTETKCYIPFPENSKKEEDKNAGLEFIYDKENDEIVCPQGKSLKLKSKNHKHRNQIYNVYQCTDCDDCPLKAKCTTSKIGRTIKRNVEQDWIDEYKKRMLEEKSKEKILERKTIVEHPFGTIKWMMGKFHFLLTGKEKVQIEIDLYATAYNFKRLMNIDNMEILLQKVQNYAWNRANFALSVSKQKMMRSYSLNTKLFLIFVA